MNREEICDCGHDAEWLYMPDSTLWNPYFCDDHVPRGCSCNHEYLDEEPDALKNAINDNVLFRLVDTPSPHVVRLDSKGREWPCCEYLYIGDEK